MAKATSKPVVEKAKAKKAAPKEKATSVVMDIEKASEEALAGLKLLKIETQLQADIEWCLGSYRNDRNPVGLYDVAGHALTVFQAEQKIKSKPVITKVIKDLETALQSR